MQNVSKLYQDIVAGDHWFETRLCINSENPENGYGEDYIISVSSSGKLFNGTPSVGGTCARDIEINMICPDVDIPKRSKLSLFVRAKNDSEVSEWIPKGKFYIDSRGSSTLGDVETITLHGYDGMLFAEADYPSESKLDWPAKDIDVVQEIATDMGIGIDSRVSQIITSGYKVQYPAGYSERETLGYIGAMYAGNWCMNDFGELMLIPLAGLPKETRYLIVGGADYRAITFGGDRILV